MVVAVVVGWWVGWLCDGLTVDNLFPGSLGKVPWANRITGESQWTRYCSGAGVTRITREKEHTTSDWDGEGQCSAWQPHSARVIRSQILIQDTVGSMLGKSQGHPESCKAGPQEWQDVDMDGLRVACCQWCCVEKATGT